MTNNQRKWVLNRMNDLIGKWKDVDEMSESDVIELIKDARSLYSKLRGQQEAINLLYAFLETFGLRESFWEKFMVVMKEACNAKEE